MKLIIELFKNRKNKISKMTWFQFIIFECYRKYVEPLYMTYNEHMRKVIDAKNNCDICGPHFHRWDDGTLKNGEIIGCPNCSILHSITCNFKSL